MLNGTLALEDVADVEAFCGRLLDDQLHRFGARLLPHDREDALSYLVAEAWRLSECYDASVGQSFSKYAHSTLKLRVVDWYRDRFGRSRWRFWWQVTSSNRETYQLYRSGVSSFRIAVAARIVSVGRSASSTNVLGITVHSRANTEHAYVSATVRDAPARTALDCPQASVLLHAERARGDYFTWKKPRRIQDGRRLRLRVTLRAGGVLRPTSLIFRAP